MWKWLNDLLNPHVHVWTNVVTLHDNPDKPTATTVVQTCEICGEPRKLEFRAPPAQEKCPPHKWEAIGRTPISGSDPKRPNLIDGYVYTLRCTRCGDLSARTLDACGMKEKAK